MDEESIIYPFDGKEDGDDGIFAYIIIGEIE